MPAYLIFYISMPDLKSRSWNEPVALPVLYGSSLWGKYVIHNLRVFEKKNKKENVFTLKESVWGQEKIT
jgi:hypothetical protein